MRAVEVIALLVVASGPAFACAPDEGHDESSATGTTSTTSSASDQCDPLVPVDEPTSGSAEADFEAMQACMIPSVCDPLVHDIVEGHASNHGGQLLAGEVCVFTGLRDGVPGRYVYGSDHQSYDSSRLVETMIIHVHSACEVTVAMRMESFPTNPAQDNTTTYESAKLCRLTAPQFFADCLEHGNDDLLHFDCVMPGRWWFDCVESGPRCE